MAGVKLFAAIPMRPDITQQAFHDHWRHPHGTLGRRISTMRRYVQGHRLESAHLDERQCSFEGIAEVWMDNAGDALGLAVEPTYVRDAVPDEPHFIDLDRLQFFITQEEVIVSGPDHRTDLSPGDAAWHAADRAVNIKIIQLVFGTYSRNAAEDAALGAELGALRHVRCWPDPGAYEGEKPIAMIRELYWPTLTHFNEGVEAAPAAWEALTRGSEPPISLLVHAERFK